MAVFKVELDQESYEQLVTLAFDAERPPSWHITWLIKKAIREDYRAAYPAGRPPDLPAATRKEHVHGRTAAPAR